MHPFLQLDKKLKIVALKKLFILYFYAVHKILCTFKRTYLSNFMNSIKQLTIMNKKFSKISLLLIQKYNL